MISDHTKKHNISVDIICHREGMGEQFPEQVNPNVKTPWNGALFKLDDYSLSLSEHESEMFHTCVVKGMLLVKRARPDLELGFGFLSSRVRSSAQQDYSKLAKVMPFVLGAKD